VRAGLVRIELFEQWNSPFSAGIFAVGTRPGKKIHEKQFFSETLGTGLT